MTPTEQAADRVKALVEKLEAYATQESQEAILVRWDFIREALEPRNGGTWPRELFENVIEGFYDDIAEAADALTALQARVGELEGALKPLLSCLDDIETYQRRPERGDWGVECAWPHKAEAVPTRTPQVSHEFREAKQNNPSPTTGADQ